MSTAAQLQKALKQFADRKQAKLLAGFFKTGKGQYGEGDIFWGVMVPQTRLVIKKFSDLPLREIKKLLYSSVHEVRLAAVLLLVQKFENGAISEQKQIYHFYLSSTRAINNWDLVDLSAPRIVGAHLYSLTYTNRRTVLESLARSKNVWERRIAIISTLYFIVKGESRPTLAIAKILLNDPHDLIHKATGWMLREVGKRCSQKIQEDFLKKYYQKMPRTMLRYAIERFPAKRRRAYLNGTA